jgi:tetratricopeptide (TPR) repeat protein
MKTEAPTSATCRPARAIPHGPAAPRGTIGSALVAAVLLFGATIVFADPAPTRPSSADFDEVAEPLPASKSRTAADRDRLEALTLFSAGRAHEQREEWNEALRCYQRALRFDPQSSAIAQAIVPVAMRLKRLDEAVRYALKVAESDHPNPLLLRGLGGYLAEAGDWKRAVAFYEKALAGRDAAVPAASNILLRMEMGRLYFLMDEPARAADNFASVLDALARPADFGLDEALQKVLLGDAGRTYQLIGECFLAAGRPIDAEKAFDKAEHAAPNAARRQFNLARVLAKTGKPAEALPAIEAALAARLSGEDAAPYETLAEILQALDKQNELLNRLEKLRAAEPDNRDLGYFLAERYQTAGKSSDAEKLYLGLLDKSPSRAGYHALAELYRHENRYGDLLGTLGEAVDKVGILDMLGPDTKSIAGDDRLMDGILEAARAAIKADPDKVGYGARLAAALLALDAKRYDDAAEFFNFAVAARPAQAAETFMLWGVGLLLAERADDAAKVFQRGIDAKALPDDNPAFQFYLAGALAVAGRSDEALAAARIAADKNKKSARFRSRVAWVLYYAKRNAEASSAYRQLIDEFDADHASSETRDVLREARLALSNLAVLQGNVPEAEEWLEQVLDEFPDDESAMNDLGYLWADANKNLDRAWRLINRAVEIEPKNMAYRDSLGWVLYRQGKYAKAAAELEKAAAAESKPDGVVLDHLGDTYEKLGEREKARDAWRKAVEALKRDKETKTLEAVQKKLAD